MCVDINFDSLDLTTYVGLWIRLRFCMENIIVQEPSLHLNVILPVIFSSFVSGAYGFWRRMNIYIQKHKYLNSGMIIFLEGYNSHEDSPLIFYESVLTIADKVIIFLSSRGR